MPWLTITIFLPLVGVPFLLAARDIPDRLARIVGLAVTIATFAASLAILADFRADATGFQLLESTTWVGALHLRYEVGVDRGIGPPRRRAAEGRRLRADPVQPGAVPRGVAVLRGHGVDPRGHRHHLRLGRRAHPERPEAARGLLVGCPPPLR